MDVMEAVATTAPTAAPAAPQAEIVDSVGQDFKPYAALYERFGIRTEGDERVNRNLDLIWNWAASHAETPDKDGVLWQITKLNHKLGDSAYGSAPYAKVLAYVSEYNRMMDAEKRMREMEAHG